MSELRILEGMVKLYGLRELVRVACLLAGRSDVWHDAQRLRAIAIDMLRKAGYGHPELVQEWEGVLAETAYLAEEAAVDSTD